MAQYVARRLAWAVPTMLAASLLAFLLINLVPGGPFSQAGEGRVLPPEIEQQLKRQYGLDRPLLEQYLRFVASLLRGDLGVSLVDFRPVWDLLQYGIPVSIELGATALLVALLLGIPLGVAAAVRRGTWVDQITSIAGVLGICIPSFVLGMLLIVVFSLQLHWLPVSGWGTPSHLVLPALALAAEPLAVIASYTRAGMLDVLREQYITVARSKGLAERIITLKHALRSALIPTVTAVGLVLPRLVIGSFLIEAVFAVPGSGRYFVIAISRRDYPVMLNMITLYVTVVIVVNLIVDVLYSLIDPRIRYA